MRLVKVNVNQTKSLKDWLETSLAARLWLWLAISLTLSITLFRGFWVSLPTMLSPDWVLGQYHASSWGVLALCLIFLWLKRKEVWKGMNESAKLKNKNSKMNFAFCTLNFTLGMALVVGAVLMPSSRDFLVFQVFLAWLGVFIMIFGKEAAKIPAILLVIYGFVISFPLAIERFAEEAYPHTAIVPLTGLMSIMGYPWQIEGQWAHWVSSGGEPISVVITVACAGPATMGVFIALFVLMTLDIPLPPKKAAWLFLFGIVGTWFQSVIRLVILMLVGYYLGKDALWTAHYWTIYLLFPLWYLFFAYVYFRQAGRPLGARRKQELKYTLVTET